TPLLFVSPPSRATLGETAMEVFATQRPHGGDVVQMLRRYELRLLGHAFLGMARGEATCSAICISIGASSTRPSRSGDRTRSVTSDERCQTKYHGHRSDRPGPQSSPRNRIIRVVELSSNSTTSDRDRRKSLKDRNPEDFSLNDGSIRFICAFTAELCSQSASSYSSPICNARVSSAVAAACESGGSVSSGSTAYARIDLVGG